MTCGTPRYGFAGRPGTAPGTINPTVVGIRWQTEQVKRTLLLGRGWIGGTIETAAGHDDRFDGLTTIDPPFDPVLAARDEAATTHLRRLIEETGIDSVINACGLLSGTPEQMEDANHHFVEWLCDALNSTGVRLLHIGSASEYGDPGTAEPIDESHSTKPVGVYATTKARGAETVLRARDQGLEASVARVFNIVGHPIPPVSPVHQWLTDIEALGPNGGRINVWWPPTTRDFSLVEDVALSLLDLVMTDSTPDLVNVCSGIALRYDDIALAIAAELGVEIEIHSLDRPGIECVIGDPGLLRTLTGRVPDISVRTIARTVTGGNL